MDLPAVGRPVLVEQPVQGRDVAQARRILEDRLMRLNTTVVSGLLRKIDWHINSL